MIYGKSGEKNSMLYDPLYTMKTTIAGQMLLSLWSEKLVEAEPRIKFIQHNTKYHWCCKTLLIDGKLFRA